MRLISNLQKSFVFKKSIRAIICALMILYIFFIPAFGESSSTLKYLVYFVMVLLTVCVTVYCFLYEDFKVSRFIFLIPFFALFALFGTMFYSHSFRRWLSLVLLAISSFTFFYGFRIIKNKFLILHIISIAFFAFSLLFVLHYRTEIINFKEFASGNFRLGNYFDNPNGVAAFEVVGFAAPLYIILFYNKKRRFFHLAPLVFAVLVGISTGSRSYILAIAIFVIIFPYFKFKKRKWIYIFVVGALTAGFIGFLQLPFMLTIRERMIFAIQTLFGVGNKVDTSTLSRVLWSEYGFFLGVKNLIFGYGADGFSRYSGVNTYAHNNYAEVICNFGLVGFVLFYLPLIVLLLDSFKSKHVDKSLIISFVIYYLVISFSNVLYYKKIYYMVIAFLFFLSFSSKENKCVGYSTIKKIVFTCDSMSAGGAEKVIATLSNGFVKKSIDVVIVGVSDSSNHLSFYQLDSRIKYISLNKGLSKPLHYLKRIYRLRTILKKEKPDIVISFLPHINVYTWLSLFGTKIPFVVSERNDPNSNPKGALLRILKRMSFVASNGCVFQTSDAMNYYKQSVIDKSVVIPNPFIQHLNAMHKEKKNVILSIGRLVEQKNHMLLLNAFAKANEILQDKYILRIYGDGPLRDVLENQAQKLGISRLIEFKGNDNQWQTKEVDDSLFVLSSNYEGMPNSLIEAMSLGIPCLSTDCPCGGPRELSKLGFNVTLVNVNDCDMLSCEIVNCIKRYGASFDKSNMELCNQFDVSIICDKWIEYIGKINYGSR